MQKNTLFLLAALASLTLTGCYTSGTYYGGSSGYYDDYRPARYYGGYYGGGYYGPYYGQTDVVYIDGHACKHDHDKDRYYYVDNGRRTYISPEQYARNKQKIDEYRWKQKEAENRAKIQYAQNKQKIDQYRLEQELKQKQAKYNYEQQRKNNEFQQKLNANQAAARQAAYKNELNQKKKQWEYEQKKKEYQNQQAIARYRAEHGDDKKKKKKD